jgi:small subunit ribosomal protein S17e
LRNKIAGYVTHLTKRVNNGSIRGISLKLQEKEKNSKTEPKLSEFIKNAHTIEIDSETYKMLQQVMVGSASSLIEFKVNTL